MLLQQQMDRVLTRIEEDEDIEDAEEEIENTAQQSDFDKSPGYVYEEEKTPETYGKLLYQYSARTQIPNTHFNAMKKD